MSTEEIYVGQTVEEIHSGRIFEIIAIDDGCAMDRNGTWFDVADLEATPEYTR